MQVLIIGRGLNGWHATGLEGKNRCSSSGGTLEGYLAQAADDTPIYDAAKANVGDFASFVCNGPMADCTLPAGEVNRFGAGKSLAAMAPHLGGGFRAIAAGALAGITSLDFVATDVYLALLRERVPGVKFGVVKDHKVEWEP